MKAQEEQLFHDDRWETMRMFGIHAANLGGYLRSDAAMMWWKGTDCIDPQCIPPRVVIREFDDHLGKLEALLGHMRALRTRIRDEKT